MNLAPGLESVFSILELPFFKVGQRWTSWNDSVTCIHSTLCMSGSR